MKRTLPLCIWLLSIVSSQRVSFADGGVLEFRDDIHSNETIAIPDAEGFSIGRFEERKARKKLDGPNPQDVTVFVCDEDGFPPLHFSQEAPPRLLIDLDDNGEFDSDREIHSTKSAGAGFSSFLYAGVPAPIRTPGATVTVRIDVSVYLSQWYSMLESLSVKSGYDGRLIVDGKEYEARLLFRALMPEPNRANEVLILDGNGDGVFDYLDDPCLACNAVGYLDGRFWEVRTSFSQEQAEISLKPYSGELGEIEITGTGLRRLLLNLRSSPTMPEDSKAFLVSIPVPEATPVRLPQGEYRIETAFVDLDESSDHLLKLQEGNENRRFQIEPSAPVIPAFHLGGPLQEPDLGVPETVLLPTVSFSLGPLKNENGYLFETAPRSPKNGRRMETPIVEVLAEDGSVVASGRFEYG